MRNQKKSNKGKKYAKRALAMAAAGILALSPMMEMEASAETVDAMQASTVVVQGAGGGGGKGSSSSGGGGHAGYVKICEDVIVGNSGSGDGSVDAGSGGSLDDIPTVTGSSIEGAEAGSGGDCSSSGDGGVGEKSSYTTSGSLIISGDLTIRGGNGGQKGSYGNGGAGGNAELDLGTLVCVTNSALSLKKGTAGNSYQGYTGGSGGIAVATIGAIKVTSNLTVTLDIDEGCSLSLGAIEWAGGNTSGTTILTYNRVWSENSSVTVSCSNGDATWQAMNEDEVKATVKTTPGAITNSLDLRGTTSIKITPEIYNISGTVKAGTTDADVSGLAVNLYKAEDTGFTTSLGQATTDVEGNYTIYGAGSGSYVVRVTAEASGNYDASKASVTVSSADVNGADITLTKTVINNSGGHSSKGSGSASTTTTTTTTTTNSDGSTITKVVDKATGAVTETTKYQDGSQKTVTTTSEKQSDGSTVKSELTVETDKDGKTTAATAEVTSDSESGEVSLPAAIIKTLAESEGSTLNIQTKYSKVVFDHAACQALAEKAGQTPTVTINSVAFSDLPKAAQAQLDEATTYSFDVNGSGIDFGTGTVTVTLDYTRKAKDSVLSVFFVDDEGSMTKMSNVSFKDDKVTYRTNHFSLYAIAEMPMPFSDVAESAYYHDAVIWALSGGITEGTTDTTFNPAGVCNRAQAVTFLWRTMGSPEPTATVNPFKDVNPKAYYYKAVLWAAENGIVKGESADTFNPNAVVTRAQTVAFMYRAAEEPAFGAVNSFSDVAADAYYAGAVSWAAENGIASGSAADTFNPAKSCSRGEMVTFMQRYAEK